MKREDSIQKVRRDIKRQNQLKSRLFNQGFKYSTLPSVKRQIRNQGDNANQQKNSTLVVALCKNPLNPNGKIVKQQASVFKRTSLGQTGRLHKFEKAQEIYNRQSRVHGEPIHEQERNLKTLSMSQAQSIQKVTSSYLNNKPQERVQSRQQLRSSKSAYRIMSTTTQQNYQREKTVHTLLNEPLPVQRAKTAKVNEDEMRRTRVLMDRISGKQHIDKKYTFRAESANKREVVSQKIIKFPTLADQQFVPSRPIKQLDRYIQLILKNVAHVDEFVYLKKSKNYQQDPYDLEVIDYAILKKEEKTGLKQYYTISKKGLCYYYQNTPKDFQSLNTWLEERSTFDRIKSLNFFRQFRKWKTLKMWNKTILREKITLCSEALKQKLFFLDDNLRTVLLNIRSSITQVQDLRIINYASTEVLDSDSTFTLEKFSRVQKKNRAGIIQKITICSNLCREEVKTGFKRNIDLLRTQNKPVYNKTEGQTKKLPKNYTPSSKEAAYEKLQFPDSMDYQMRSKLRNQCMRFIRFSFLIDFIAMTSLKEVYMSSLLDLRSILKQKTEEDDIYVLKEQKEGGKQTKSHLQPLFSVEIHPNFKQMPAISQRNLEPFMLPPTGTSHISDFHITAYVNFRIPKQKKLKKGQQLDSEYQQMTTFTLKQPQQLSPHWLQLYPSAEEHYAEIKNCLGEGIDALQCFQRWSRHPDMQIYIDVLQQWDDKISDKPLQGDLFLHPDEWIERSTNQIYKTQIRNTVEKSFGQILAYIYAFYEKYLLMYWEDKRIDFSMYTSELLADPNDAIQYSMENLIYQTKCISNDLPLSFDKQILKVHCLNLKKTLAPLPAECLQRIFNCLPIHISDMSKEVGAYLQQSTKQLKISTTNVADFVQQMKSLKAIDKKLPKIKDKVSLIGQIINILETVKPHIQGLDKDSSKKWKAIQTYLLQNMMNLENAIIQAEDGSERNLLRFAEQVSKNLIPNLNKEIGKMEAVVEQKKFLTQIPMGEAIKELQQHDNLVKRLQEDARKYSQYELTLNMPESKFETLYELRANLDRRLEMWKGLRDWGELSSQWMKTVFDQINVQQIKQMTDKYTKIVSKCSKKLPPNPILQKLKSLLKVFKEAMPVVIALSNKLVQEDVQYWGEIQKIVGKKFTIDENFTLQNMVDMNFHVYQNQIIEISTQAKQEQILKAQIEENKAKWLKLEFTTKQYKVEDPRMKETFVLDKVDDTYTQIDELLANFSSILGNRYLKRQRAQAEELQKTVYSAMLIMDDWLIVQKNWIYLQNIFSSSDIKTKLRQENAKFENIDKNFKAHMKATARTKLVYKNLGVHDTWVRYKETLSEIQKQLEKYLEDKRNDFPRFYFLSNDELIQILAKANEIDAIQKNIKKCFECVGKLVFQDDTRYIESVASLEGEVLKIAKSGINAKGQIQNWLKLLETAMDETLKKYIAKGFLDFQQTRSRLGFIESHISQVSLVVSQVNWTMDTEALLENLDEYFGQLLKQLTELTAKIRDPDLPILTRKTLIALITQDVHNRDIVESLMEQDAGVNKTDFIWTQQLRMYNQGEGFDTYIIARQVNAQIYYGYQYLGVMSRLVITPLTDRCWMTIIGAINIKLGASPAGPAGTGKTQSTKDLAKGLGMLCVVFNCSEQIDYKIMGRLFSGLAQQGAWSCLDQFNRIDIQVLSVIAQQLLTIRVAKLRGDTTFQFIDRKINLKPNCGVFITMNPGYAGRTELPDNLKVLFRSMSMMIPDYRLIAEIMLFAEGFEQAKVLSKKMVQLYKLSSEQLSQQDHYDFGMRAVKSVLVMAGALKRADKEGSSEQQVLIRAMRNSNIPKFLKEDLPLFEALISDLFPHAEIKQPNYQQFSSEVNSICSSLSLQIVPSLTKKAIQLFETFNVRFGVMVVGQTTSGKTTCSDILAKSMTSFRVKKHPNQLYKTVKKHVLNPKSISMGELYGQVNQLTQQWNDGLASSIMRECTNQDDPDTMNWVVFDGPVDALWIENMNTVLDDNMMLCLANGERIKLLPSMRMLFEVMDLKVASPATVSRCGMVYMISQDLGWRPYITSWLTKWVGRMIDIDEDQPFWSEEMKLYISQLFDKSIDNMYKFISKKTEQPIITLPLQLATSLANLFDIFCTVQYGFKKGQDREYKKRYVTYAYTYAFIWSLCVTAFDKYHEELSFQCRSTFEQLIYPGNDSVQNFYFDANQLSLKHWSEKLPQFVYQKEQGFHEIIVDTIDTIRYSSVISLLSQNIKPILITGPSGTGKSIQLSRVSKAPLVLTSTTSHYQLQLSIQSKLDKIRKNMLGAPMGSFCIVAIDDTNMPAEETYGAIPPIEVLRGLIDKKGAWDRKQRFWKFVQNTAFVCACSPPGGGRNYLTPRFTRHFNVMCLPEPSHSSLTRIYKEILDGFFNANNFFDAVKKSSETLVNGTIQIYTILKKDKLPIPSKFHYTFNLRDVSKICQGILQAKNSTIRDVEALGKLWFHEVSRVFKDRLNTEQDHQWLHDKMHDILEVNFRVRKRDSKIYFSNILRLDTREYQEIVDLKKVVSVLEEFQEDHNAQVDSKLNLVFFNEAVENILRIQRILSMARGNALLIGVSGSGKQSLTRLASYINTYKVKQIQITKGYNIASFRDFLKDLMKKSSNNNQAVTFLFTDNQIIDEIFLQDINNLLNSGEIPNLWEIQEKEQIIDTTRPFNAALKRSEAPQAIYRTFVERVRERIHVVLSMSPIGDALRVRCRKFPALVNCCTINWFFPWPQDALISVASAVFENYEKFPSYSNIPKRQQVIQTFADICKQVHNSANEEAKKFESVLKRKVYTTPKSYLDMLKLYLFLLEKKQNQVFEKRDRLTGGLDKLQKASKQVADLQIRLKKLQPQLQMQSEMLSKALVEVQLDSRKANDIKMVVAAQAEEVAKQKNQIQTLTDQARERLKQVEPDLQKAKRAVQTIDRKALQTIRSYPKPPPVVQIIMEGVCILFGIKGDWDVQKKLLIKLDEFITSLKEYKKDSIPQDRLIKLRQQLQRNEFKEEVIVKKVRQMLEIAQWCKAIQKYAVVAKEIEPKKKKMAFLSGQLNKANQQLAVKQATLNQAEAQVNKLRNQTEAMVQRKQSLQKELQLTKDRLVRAADLVRLTKDEAIRWKETVVGMASDILNLPIDVFLSAAAISYNGPFTGSFRKSLVDYWITIINAKELPMSQDYHITKTLGDPLILREWMINGLPSDSTSQENAIFAMEGNRWPLVIDPQEQASKWLDNLLRGGKKCITKLSDPKFQPDMRASIKNGVPVLLVDVEDTLPAVLDSVFSKEIKTIDNMPMIKFGDENIYYDNKFQIFIFTKVPNPNFLPQIFIRVNIINFTVTFEGLKQQLLAMVVKHERQEVEREKDQNIVKMGQYNRRITQSELNILRLLQKANADTILDDVELIETLKDSQQAAGQIKIKMEQSKQIEKRTNQIRQHYKPVSTRGAVLFFVIKDLALIDNMYQYSLQYIQKLFHISMETAPSSQILEVRLHHLRNQITKDIYKNITRGLFVKDKVLFSFLIAASISRDAKVISEDLWFTFVRGPTPTQKSSKQKPMPNPSKYVYSERGWELAQYLEANFAKFTGLTYSLTNKIKVWQGFLNYNRVDKFPDEWDTKLDLFQKMLLYRAVKPERVIYSMSHYVVNTIGAQYLQTPNVTIKEIWSGSDQRTPMIFVLSPGADSTSALLKFAKEMNVELDIISLGQGQGGPAQNLIRHGKTSGKWILLQNCHLAKTWMPRLQQLVAMNLNPSQEIHIQFRLFLTSMPALYFPASVLQNGIKLTTEPPRGIKANLKRSWNEIDEEQLSACAEKPETLHKMLWGLTFFHAIIQERQKFGPLGWNIKYEFNDSDLQTSKTVLQMLLNRQDPNIPFEALLFVTGQINYGGRVTDDWDRRCLMTILRKFYTPSILENKYIFSEAKQYYIPEYQSLENYRSYVQTLPLNDETTVFGMHENANTTYLLQEQRKVMSTLEMIQPKQFSAGGKSAQDIIFEMVSSILTNKEVPEPMDPSSAQKDLLVINSKGLLPSLSIVLFQQLARFNKLLKVIRNSLEDLKKAINGFILMSDQLDDMFYDLLANRVPKNWKKVAYPSLKPMSSWMKDLRERVAFINGWLTEGTPFNYWLSSFFFPQGFLTGVLQEHARQPQKEIPIDQLIFTFRFTEYSRESCNTRPTQGIYVGGLILEGGCWDTKKRLLVEPIKGQMYNFMPVVSFVPTKIDEKKINQKYDIYECPVYKTSVRAGVLSTTGQSTNFVLAVQLPSVEESDYWVLQGTAILLQLSD